MFKRNTLLVSMLLAVPMISQANITEPEIYGRVVMTGQYQKDKGESTTQLASHSSRFGIKGNHDISENVKATYQLEYGINPFTSTTFSDRNQFVGLTGDWGLATMGRRDTAMKNASTGVHHFNAGGMDAILSTIMNGENRADQQISYRSPVIANLVRAEFTYLPEAASGQADKNGLSSAVMLGDKSLRKQPYYFVVAADSKVKERDIVRLTAQTSIADLKLGAIYSDEKNLDTDEKGSAYSLSASYPIGDTTLLAQYMDGDVDNKSAETIYSLGFEHKLSRSFRLLGYVANTEYEGDRKDKTTFAAGFRYDF